ncbi:hypothetical protein ACWOE5_03085 [Aerococcus sanguinicola]|uniref:Uncharacterized protein n=2 Tax=Aerococcus sanguinicola TaxID=119206 RepID=A0A109RDK9_9LACT|nr:MULTISPECIES: hypothetical protein [Aerococcus]AMB94536.1 hypothetical protein AWM72_07125 [Aerococcus sanguinicola]MDK7049416.1 hypothetical protein [Aerococcus sanguinicola]OFT97048.1 hypothetical protein HMPREF3090_01445 [Aerococcus sp. HMSC23C02]PKZ23468.1 hypothetical protein CYJ28_02630 [Aerococcus sanguinicola]
MAMPYGIDPDQLKAGDPYEAYTIIGGESVDLAPLRLNSDQETTQVIHASRILRDGMEISQ